MMNYRLNTVTLLDNVSNNIKEISSEIEDCLRNKRIEIDLAYFDKIPQEIILAAISISDKKRDRYEIRRIVELLLQKPTKTSSIERKEGNYLI